MDQEALDKFSEMCFMVKEMHNMIIDIYNTPIRKERMGVSDEYLDRIAKVNHEVAVEKILSTLYSYGPIAVSHSVILRKVYKKLHGKVPEFLMIMHTLEQNGQIVETLDNGCTMYALTPHEYKEQDVKHKLYDNEMPIKREVQHRKTRSVDVGPWEAAGFGPRKVDPPATNMIKSATGADIDLDGVIDLTQ